MRFSQRPNGARRCAPLLLLALLQLLALIPASPLSAQEPREVVERWNGTIQVSRRFDTRGTPAELLFTGQQLERYRLRYNLAADADGFINGDIDITLTQISVSVEGDGTCIMGALRDCFSAPVGGQLPRQCVLGGQALHRRPGQAPH